MTKRSSFSEIRDAHSGKLSDKWSSYLSIYDRLFEEFREKKVSLLEIGIQNGGALEVYETYFHDFEVIVGCDIDQRCGILKYPNNNIKVVVGNCNDDATIAEIVRISRDFDIIIDDGSHTSGDIITAFLKYFPLLRNGGIYVIEDLCCSYWQNYNGGLFHNQSSISFLKLLVDIVNYEHWGIVEKRRDLINKEFSSYNGLLNENVLSEINSIQFLNSVCVIRKDKPERNSLGIRCIVGSEALVNEELQSLNGAMPPKSWERGNRFPMLLTETTIDSENNRLFFGRNKLCPCGSGKRFKHCHGKYE